MGREQRGPRGVRRGLELQAMVLLLAGLVACARRDPASEWAQWRGPHGLGIAEQAGLPTSWTHDSPNVRWRTKLAGTGNSSPIVSGGRIYLTLAEAAEDADGSPLFVRAVTCLRLEDGAILWTTPVFRGPEGSVHEYNTLAAPTSASDGERVFAYFGSVLASLDPSGTVLWTKEVEPEYFQSSRYGAASSPVLTRRAVIVAQDREYAKPEYAGWLAAFDKLTGEEIWRTQTESCCTYSTPLVVERGDAEEIVWAQSGYVAGYDAASGERLWKHEYVINQLVSSPVIAGDILVVSGGAHNIKQGLALRLTGSGRSTKAELLWEHQRMIPQTSSPVLYQGRLFTVTDQGVMVAHEVTTGKEIWRARLARGGNFASLVAGDGKVYVSSRSGWLSVIAASDEYSLLSENHLGEAGSTASPAIAGRSLVIRDKESLFRVEPEPH